MSPQVIPDALLRRLVPIFELEERSRALLGEGARLDKVMPGREILSVPESRWFLYLVSGTLSLVTPGSAERVTADTDRAMEPIFGEEPGEEFAIVEKPSILLRIDRMECTRLLSEASASGVEVTDVELTPDEMGIFHEVCDACTGNKLELPPMPEVAMRIQRMAGDLDVKMRELARVVQTDPAVAGALIHAANSPLYRGTSTISSVRDAISRLGLDTTRSLASSLAMRKAFEVKSPLVKKRLERLWAHSVNVSAITFVLARRSRLFDPERALLAGLMHDIGIIPILRHIERHNLKPTARALEHTIGKLRAMSGIMVMNYWQMDPDFLAVIEEADEWERDHPAPADLCDLVVVAQLFEPLGGEEQSPLPHPRSVPAFARIFPDGEDDLCAAVMAEAENEMADIRRLLHG